MKNPVVKSLKKTSLGQKKTPLLAGSFFVHLLILQASVSLPPHGYFKKEKIKIGNRLKKTHLKKIPFLGLKIKCTKQVFSCQPILFKGQMNNH